MSRSGPPPDALREALRELADADVAELIASARDRARERAARVIEDAIFEELLDAAARVHRAAPHDPGKAHDSQQAWWTYCVLSASDAANVPSGLEGIDPSGPVEVLCEGELAALVSRVPAAEYNDARLREHLEDLAWIERTARRHEAVLDAALSRITIVPLRLCTIYLDEQGVRRLLRRHAESLELSLAKVAGCAEWGVKMFADGSAPAETEPEEHSGSAGRPGATYLVARQRERERAEQTSQLRASCAEAVHERISKLARDAVANPPQRPELHGRGMAMLLNGAYLVMSEHLADLREAIRELQAEWEEHGFVIELTGPWPAYNFVSGAGGLP